MTLYNDRRFAFRFACVGLLCGLLPLALTSQEADANLKPVKKIAPAYPDVLKKAGISGTVRVRVTIGPDGTVKDVAPIGGGAIFIDAVTKAVKQWRYAATGERQRVAEVSASFECCSTVTTTP
jgi:TonB family protein